MKRKTWALLCLAAVLSAFACLSAVIIWLDPFQVYRLAVNYMPPFDRGTQVYSNAGVVRHYDYDSAVVGTSVTENFYPSQMDSLLGGRFIKLSTSAGTAYNHALLMRLAFETHEMKRIVYGLDVYSFVNGITDTGSEVPLYLYNNNPFDDVQYWLNRSVLGSYLPRCLRKWGQKQDDTLRDSMYNWAGEGDEYGEYAALYTATFTPPEEDKPVDAFLAQAEANLAINLLPFVTAHPETHFDIFYPPYSAAEWSNMKSRGTLDANLAVRGCTFDALSACPNVTIYDFSTREEWVLNLDNYKDPLHYGEWINMAITESIAHSECVITDRAQLDTNTETLRGWACALIDAGGWIF